MIMSQRSPLRAESSTPKALADPATASAGLATGVVLSLHSGGTGATVASGGARVEAAIAVSCLIRPLPDDLVLLFLGEDEAFVLSVLDRPGPNYGELALPGSGNLSITGETVSVAARQRLALKGEVVDLQARALTVLAQATTWLGKSVTAMVDRWRATAKSHEVDADAIVERSVTRTAIVEETDSLRARTRAVVVSGIASETAASKIVAVREDLRMDGKRITMG